MALASAFKKKNSENVQKKIDFAKPLTGGWGRIFHSGCRELSCLIHQRLGKVHVLRAFRAVVQAIESS